MPTLDEMLAQSTEYGPLGGYRKAKEDIRTQEVHDIAKEEKKVDISTKKAELQDFIEGRKMRRKKRAAETKAAERELKYADLLDEQTKVQLDASINELSNRLHSSQLETLARGFGGVKDQKSYEQFLKSVDQEALDALNFSPTGAYKQDRAALEYLQTIATKNMEHKRALEMQAVQNAGTAASRTTGELPGQAKMVSMNDLPDVAQSLAQDPVFSKLTERWGFFPDQDPLESEELKAVGMEVIGLARQIQEESNNYARSMRNPNLAIGQFDAITAAKRQIKVAMHKVDDGEITIMQPGDYLRMKENFFVTYDTQMRAANPLWDKLPQDRKQAILNKKFIDARMMEYNNAVSQQSYMGAGIFSLQTP